MTSPILKKSALLCCLLHLSTKTAVRISLAAGEDTKVFETQVGALLQLALFALS